MNRLDQEKFFCAGKWLKTHGVQGELCLLMEEELWSASPYVVCMMDGLPVPFFPESQRTKNDSVVIVKLEGIDSEEQARALVGKEVYLPESMIEHRNQVSLSYFTGFLLMNGETPVGNICGYNDDTENYLFQVAGADGTELWVPVVEAWIQDINHEQRRLVMDLPAGLLEINR